MRHGVLADLDLAGLVDAFARAYEDYMVPLRFDSARLDLHVRAHDIALEHSPLVRDEKGGLVGLAMLGVRAHRGWIGGFGVAKEHRGRGHSHALCAEAIDRARDLGLAHLQLEVLEGNARAIATYARAGFVRTRVLASYRCEPGAAPGLGGGIDLSEIGLESFSWSRVASLPGWQRERASVMRMPGLAAFSSGDAEALVSVTQASVLVLALACDDEPSAARLLGAVASRHPDRPAVVMNEPEGTLVERAILRRGWAPFVRQHEMALPLRGQS